MEYTNRTEFCISCHEMSIPYEELKKTVSCADCHVASSKYPNDYGRKLTMKVLAARANVAIATKAWHVFQMGNQLGGKVMKRMAVRHRTGARRRCAR